MEIPFSDGSGALLRHAAFESAHIEPRNVDVWLPPGAGRCGVLYMHDGQNLFDPAQAYGGVDWGVDEALTRLVSGGLVPRMIVVGIWNSAQRWRDYMPQRPLELRRAAGLRARFVREQGGPPRSDAYLRFLVDELKPFIDRTYPTLPGLEHTFVMGSSMGGLISLYALEQAPAVFGGAGCVSTHWPAGGKLLVDALGAALPAPGAHRLYFDYGTTTLDKGYEPYQQRMDGLLRARGYTPGKDWLTHKFAGAEHSERSWRERIEIPLRFLLGHG